MDDPREAARIIDRITTSVMPDLMAKVGEAYLRGYPFMLRHGADGLDVEIIPADQFYITSDSPSERKR